jgi:hypothetical protein
MAKQRQTEYEPPEQAKKQERITDYVAIMTNTGI